MQMIFDITSYGATGDGKSDDTAAIQAALDDAAKCRGTVTVPPGTYYTGKLRMGPGVSLEGHAAWSFRSYGASMFKLNDPDAESYLCVFCDSCFTGLYGEKVGGFISQAEMQEN